MLLTLLRHGEVDGRQLVFRGRSDLPLSMRGLQQLHTAAAVFDRPRIDRLVSSPKRRCREFCTSWAAAHSVQICILDALREIDFGDWEERSPEEAAAHDPASYERLRTDPASWRSPNGESYRDFRRRVLDALRELRKRGDEHVGVVTHAGVIRVILAEILNINASSIQRIAVAPASACRIWYDASGQHQLLALDNGPTSWPAD